MELTIQIEILLKLSNWAATAAAAPGTPYCIFGFIHYWWTDSCYFYISKYLLSFKKFIKFTICLLFSEIFSKHIHFIIFYIDIVCLFTDKMYGMKLFPWNVVPFFFQWAALSSGELSFSTIETNSSVILHRNKKKKNSFNKQSKCPQINIINQYFWVLLFLTILII